MNRKLSKTITRPVYLFLLPLFFVMHGLNENFGLVPVKNAAGLFLVYLVATLIVFGVARWLYRDPAKAGFFAFMLMAFFFFFGSLHDFIKKITDQGFMSRYSFILPASLLLFFLIAIFTRHKRRSFLKTSVYLNVLFIILVLIESATFVIKTSKSTRQKEIIKNWNECTDCDLPDIYLIVSDGYPGWRELKDKFSYDNSGFETALKERGFYVIDSSRSNYNTTIYSVASMLDLKYIENISSDLRDINDQVICYKTINQAALWEIVRSNGYEIYNHSIFKINNLDPPANPAILPSKNEYITAQTFTKRIERDLAHNLVTWLKLKFVEDRVVTKKLQLVNKSNQKLIRMTVENIPQEKNKPRFVYTHLVMPHCPYYYDSLGNKMPNNILKEENYTNLQAFIQYLAYSNKVLLNLVDQIKKETNSRAIIVLMSDHGFREFPVPVDPSYYYMNLISIYHPGKQYQGFYRGMSNVNFFRNLVNNQFKQQLPHLKDSTVFISY